MDLSKIDNIEFEDIYTWDYPDFCDAYISYAENEGCPLTDSEMLQVNNDSEFVYEKLMEYLY